jgi:hypothetical protein
MAWPTRGVYFFFEDGERRTTSGSGPRIVRVGTHALVATSTATLWRRLSQHRGTLRSGGGNHRGSVFRSLVGDALVERDGHHIETWGSEGSLGAAAKKHGLSREVARALERPVELEVTRAIGAMPFLWVDVDDSPGPSSLRGVIERNSIALLSNAGRDAVDPPSAGWLGAHSARERVRASGLWNSNHVDEQYDSGFLEVLARLVE